MRYSHYIQKGAMLLLLVGFIVGVSTIPSYVHTQNPILDVQDAYLINATGVKDKEGDRLLFAIMDVDGNEYIASYSSTEVQQLKSGCPSLGTDQLVTLMKAYYKQKPIEVTMNTRWFPSVMKVHVTDKIINFQCHA